MCRESSKTLGIFDGNRQRSYSCKSFDMIQVQTCRIGADVALVAYTDMLSRDTKCVEPVRSPLVSANLPEPQRMVIRAGQLIEGAR